MKSKKRNRKKLLLTVIAILVVLSAVLFVLEKRGVTNFYSGSGSNSQESDDNAINFGPPTEEEQRAGDEQKDKIVGEDTPSQDTGQNKRNANVIITDAGQYDDIIEVRAFIPNHYEEGTCTITFTQDTHKIVKQAPAYPDSSTTICTNPLINRSEFPESGTWKLVVSYSSNGAAGTSEVKDITIN